MFQTVVSLRPSAVKNLCPSLTSHASINYPTDSSNNGLMKLMFECTNNLFSELSLPSANPEK